MVPDVVGAQFDRAVVKLLERKLLVSVPRFVPFHDAMAEQGWGRLETLTLDRPVFRGPLGSMAEPVRHPEYASIPNLVGKGYRQAMENGNSGVLVRVSRTGPLSPTASPCRLNAFVVSSQTPRPGTRVPWGGVLQGGVHPSLATVTITLVSRPPV